jgi:hypothetical protein
MLPQPGSEATDLLAMIDECSGEGANLLLWQCLLDYLLYLELIHVFADIVEALQNSAHMSVDSEFRAFMYPCHGDTGYMTSDSAHSLESASVVGDLASESLEDGLGGLNGV